MPKVIWDSSQICQTNSPFPRSKPVRFQWLWKLFFSFWSHLAVPWMASAVHSFSSFTWVSLYQTLCGFPPLRLQIFLNCFSLNHNLPFSTTNDAFFFWLAPFVNTGLFKAEFLIAPSLTFPHFVDFMLSNFACFSSLSFCSSSLVFSLALYFSILVCPTLPVHVSYLSFCHLGQNQSPW